MRSVILIGFAALLIAGVYDTNGAGNDEQKTSTTRDTVQRRITMRIGQPTDLRSFLQESEQAIEANRQGIDALLVKIEETGPKATIRYGKNVGVLERENLQFTKFLNECRMKGVLPKRAARINFQQDMDRLGRSIDELLREPW